MHLYLQGSLVGESRHLSGRDHEVLLASRVQFGQISYVLYLVALRHRKLPAFCEAEAMSFGFGRFIEFGKAIKLQDM